MTILVACGLRREARLMRSSGVVPVVGGGVAARLEAELEAHLERFTPVAAILSSGLAGALCPSLAPGDVVLGELAGDEGRGGALLATLRGVLEGARIGPIAGSDAVVATLAEKRALHARTGAIAVDMESHVAARVAARHGLPFAILRTISDAADQNLPPAALVGMRADGGIALGAVLASLARRPAQLPDLIRTGINAERAFRSLLRSHHALAGARIGQADPREFLLDM